MRHIDVCVCMDYMIMKEMKESLTHLNPVSIYLTLSLPLLFFGQVISVSPISEKILHLPWSFWEILLCYPLLVDPQPKLMISARLQFAFVWIGLGPKLSHRLQFINMLDILVVEQLLCLWIPFLPWIRWCLVLVVDLPPATIFCVFGSP